ncbi:MAG: ROK family transcriptional regulator [Bifidobacteriaceae bacterium]|jgi:predicted NBD/HSP70 family sugar kinase|nr:ROK family transcriptional regulator [Bifidobacteriaceae bacterium]MCI1979298.1 ROK family transcriptional regulator [Bifidobacteriaceae bacterium]
MAQKSPSGSQTALREANRALLFETVRKFGGLTQIELSEATGLSTATVSNLVRQFVDEDVFETRSTIRSGRRATLVTLRRQLGISIGMFIGKRELAICVMDFSRTILSSHSLPLALDHKVDSTIERAILLIEETINALGATTSEIVGICLAVEAPVNKATQQVAVSGILRGWENKELRAPFSSVFQVPVYVQNSAHMGGLAESRLGSARGIENFIYVHASDGVGAAAFVNGALLRGVTGLAGEIGHVQVDPLGPICSCGNRGCLNTTVNEARLVSLLNVTHGTMTLDDLITMANEGDPGCRRIVADVSVRIAEVTAQVCITLDPKIVVVGGKFAETGDLFIEPFQESLRRLLFPDALAPIDVLPAHFEKTSQITGACLFALEHSTLSMTPAPAKEQQ